MRPLVRYGTLALVLGSAVPVGLAHEDDPKLLDLQGPYRGAGYRAARAGAGGGTIAGGVEFASDGVTLLSWMTLGEFGSPANGNDCWGYVSPSGREYAIFGHYDATTFVEITQPDDPQIVATINGPNSLWRDIKVYQDHAYAVSEGGSGIQVMDLGQIDAGIVTHVGNFTAGGANASHNVAIDTVSGFLYRTGGSDNGLRIYSLANPASPSFLASWNDRYVHDAQVITYTSGPYAGRQIAFACSGFNGGWTSPGVSILDVTNKSNIVQLSNFQYPNPKYSHQAWLNGDGTLLYLNDELDEGGSFPTTTYIIDVSDLSNPSHAGSFTNGNQAVGHNLYVRGNKIYEANYRSGLRVFDATDPLNPVETAWFDTYPDNDTAAFNGLWSNYPFFPSGVVIGSDMERGLFVWWADDPLVTFDFPLGVPTVVDPGGDSITVSIAGDYVAGSGKLHYDVGAGIVTVDLVDLGGGDYRADLPAAGCGQLVAFYFSAQSSNGITWVDPPGGAGAYQATAAVSSTVVLSDTLESSGSWVSGAAGDDATTGQWTHGNPIGTDAQPEDDHTSGGTQCWFTGQGSFSGSVGENDVDGGKTTLLSPVYDLAGLSEPSVSYWRWYSNVEGGAPEADVFVVDISDDGGSSWTNLETVGPAGGEVQGGWTRHQARVADFVTPSASVRLRFVASDEGSGSIVEAAIDDLEITEYTCDALVADSGQVSVSLGGTVNFTLDPGSAYALKLYFLAGTTSGTVPGTSVDGIPIPLNPDFYTTFSVQNPNTPPLFDSFQLLDAQGRGAAKFEIPPGTSASYAGLTVHHAFAVLNGGTAVFGSNAVGFQLLP